jgi:REP-associated tyrosine transposase
MPRRPRLELSGIPLHITHRGVNRCAIFIDDEDRHHYLRLLGLFARDSGLAIHAYVLMSNHVHLLAGSLRTGAAAAALRRTTQCYVQMFNHRHRRSGTLWEGRFKSCLVSTAGYVLRVYRYIEQNPVRAGMVSSAEDYAWSSVRANLGLRFDSLVTHHPCFRGLGEDPALRIAAYRQWLLAGQDEGELQSIRAHVAQQRAYGDSRFQAMVERTLNLPAALRPSGRPAKRPAGNS